MAPFLTLPRQKTRTCILNPITKSWKTKNYKNQDCIELLAYPNVAIDAFENQVILINENIRPKPKSNPWLNDNKYIKQTCERDMLKNLKDYCNEGVEQVIRSTG